MSSPRNVANFNGRLTNFASGLSQDYANASVLNFLAPEVQVGATIGQFKRYSAKNPFQRVKTARAIGGKPNRIFFSADDPTYNCKPQGLEITIDDTERDAAGDIEGAQAALEEAKISTVMEVAATNHEYDGIAALIAGLTGETIAMGDTDDVIKLLNAKLVAYAKKNGRPINRIGIGLDLWATLKDHPKVLSRFPGNTVKDGSVNLQQFASLLIFPGIECRVATMVADANNPGAAASNSAILGAGLIAGYVSPNPNQYDASMAKTFVPRRGGVQSVTQYRDDPNLDVYSINWSRDFQITNSAGGFYLTAS